MSIRHTLSDFFSGRENPIGIGPVLNIDNVSQFIDPVRVGARELTPEAWEVWAAEVIDILQGNGDRAKLITGVCQLEISQQTNFVCHLWDHGWQKLGRRQIIPTLVSDLIFPDQQSKSIEQATALLKDLKQAFKKRAEKDDLAKEVLRDLPSEVPDVTSDLADLDYE